MPNGSAWVTNVVKTTWYNRNGSLGYLLPAVAGNKIWGNENGYLDYLLLSVAGNNGCLFFNSTVWAVNLPDGPCVYE